MIKVLSLILCFIAISFAKKHPCDGWLLHNDKCYNYKSNSMTYENANNYCKQLNSSILKPRTPEENRFITKLLHNNFEISNDVWIGITIDNNTRVATLDDGTEPIYTNWLRGQPDNYLNLGENCVEALFSQWNDYWANINTNRGKWNDVICEDFNSVVCEKQYPEEDNENHQNLKQKMAKIEEVLKNLF